MLIYVSLENLGEPFVCTKYLVNDADYILLVTSLMDPPTERTYNSSVY